MANYPAVTVGGKNRRPVTLTPDGPIDAGSVNSASSDPSILTLTPGLYLTPTMPVKPGTVTITIHATSLQGTVPITDTMQVTVTQPPASTLNPSVGPEEPNPAA
jgi:hypothetical protein